MELIGARSAMTLLREAFYGARRFDDLVGRAGLSSMAVETASQTAELLADHG